MQKYNIVLAPDAEEDLEKIYRYLATEKADGMNADKVITKLSTRILSLQTFPEGYTIFEGSPSYRIAHMERYKIFYRIDTKKKVVVIVRIMHSLQKCNYI